jgi:hypothetical protein
MIHGTALRLKLELARLHQHHRVPVASPVTLPPAAPSADAVIVSGYASTTHVDLHRMKFRPWAFVFLPWDEPPPLLWKHDASQVAGHIHALEYDSHGNLTVRATVTHAEAKRCNGFSIAGTIREYEIHNADSREFFALITRATLDEVSVTPTPCNPHALVLTRDPVSPAGRFYDLMVQRVQCLQRLVQTIPLPPPTARPTPPRAPARASVRPSPRTEFQTLVSAMNREVITT